MSAPSWAKSPSENEATLTTALSVAAEIYDGHARDAELPEPIRRQFRRQAGEARALLAAIEDGAVTITTGAAS